MQKDILSTDHWPITVSLNYTEDAPHSTEDQLASQISSYFFFMELKDDCVVKSLAALPEPGSSSSAHTASHKCLELQF